MGTIIITCVTSCLTILLLQLRKRAKDIGNTPMASDGHRVPEDQDISCRQYGHEHEEFDAPRFIPHEDPEGGYIVLNGVTMERDEADRYQDRI